MSYRILYHHRIRAEDGQAVHVRELIAALRGKGHAVDECALVQKATASNAAPRSPVKPSIWQRLSLPRSAVEVLEIGYNRRGRSMLQRAAAGVRPDFIYERHALHCHAGLDIAQELGVPLLLEVNSPMVIEMQRLGLLCFPRRAARTERTVLGSADAVLAVTRVLADLLITAGAPADRVHVIGNGAVPERYDDIARQAAVSVRSRMNLAEGAFALGFVGYMRPWHRLDLVLDVMLRPGLENLVLVLMGRGPAEAPLLETARARGLAERVVALGSVPAHLLPAHVLACDGALIPAINEYASPLKLFDSLAAGVPTLAPDQPNLRENVQHGSNGLLFTEGSADALAEQLLRLVGDRAFARQLGIAGRESLLQQRWTWEGNADRVIDVFERVKNQRRASQGVVQ